MPREEPAAWLGRGRRRRLPVRRRAQGAGPDRGAQVLGGSWGTAWAGGASIVPPGSALPAARAGRGPSARLPPLHRAGDPAGPASAAAAATGTAAAAAEAEQEEEEEEEVSARGSRFLLPGWASAGEARGGQERGSPDSVPGGLRGGRGAPLHAAPCDRRSGTAGTGEPHADDSCCSAGPPRPPAPPRLRSSGGASSAARGLQPWPGGGCRGAVPAQGPGLRFAWGPGTRSPRVIEALVAGCAAAHAVLRAYL